MTNREIPHDLEAEQAVLSAILLGGEGVMAKADRVLVDAQDFFEPRHRLIYRTMWDLFREGRAPDPVVLVNRLGDRLDEAGGRDYILDLYGSIGASWNAEHYARIVSELAVRRRLIRAGHEIVDLASETPDVAIAQDAAEAMVFDLGRRRRGADRRRPEGIGVRTGYFGVDQVVGEFAPGDLVVLAGLTGLGKTALALNIARNVAAGAGRQDPRPVLVFSLEMSIEELASRFLCAEGRVNGARLRDGTATHGDFERLMVAQERVSTWPIWLDDTSGITVAEMMASTRDIMRERRAPLGLVVVDYLQLVGVRPQRGRAIDSRAVEVATVSRELKGLAQDLQVPVLALSQFSRAAETDKGGPALRHLRESGAIEQDCSIALLMKGERGGGLREIEIGKHRNGDAGTARLWYSRRFTRFDNLVKAAPGSWHRA